MQDQPTKGNTLANPWSKRQENCIREYTSVLFVLSNANKQATGAFYYLKFMIYRVYSGESYNYFNTYCHFGEYIVDLLIFRHYTF